MNVYPSPRRAVFSHSADQQMQVLRERLKNYSATYRAVPEAQKPGIEILIKQVEEEIRSLEARSGHRSAEVEQRA